MKLRQFVVCAVTLLAPATVVRADVPLVRDGHAIATVFMPPAAPDAVDAPNAPKPKKPKRGIPPVKALDSALAELNYHLQKMSGATLEVTKTTDPAAIKGPAIVLGDLAVKLGAVPQKTVESQEGFRILTRGDLLLIGGQSDEAVLQGVYEVLGKLGCDWVMPGEIGEIIPHRTTVTFPADDESQAPDFLFRNLGYRGYPPPRLPAEGARFSQWKARQKGGNYAPPALDTSGHIWESFIKRHQAEFDRDPTMYALRRAPDGTLKRMGPQLESTHPHVIELFVQDIKDAFEKNGWPHDKAAGFGIGPADGLGYSVSAESQAAGSGRIDPIVGEPDRTDLLILLGNSILEKLGPEYPNVLVGFYSYSVHADYPMRYKPNPRIVQIFAPINFSRFHSITDTNSKTQAYYRDVVEQWGKLSKAQGNPLIYRGYNWNLAENMLPYTKLKIWGDELPFYKKQNVIGLNVEATKAWSINGPSDYLFMKLAWNSSLDWKTVLHDYCVKSFGAGAAPMERYFLRLVQTQHDAGQEAGSYFAFPLIYDDAFVAAAQNDFVEATKLAAEANEKTRISYFAASIEALRLYLAYYRAANSCDFAATKTAYDAMQVHWKESYDINTDLVANETPSYLKRFIEKFVDDGVKYSTGDYHLVAPLPDEMPTEFDPTTTGDRMQLFSPTVNDARWVKTKTYSSTWDAQGLGGLRTGAVWYRHRFRLPADVKNKPIGLFLGGFEDEARVWINGKLIGTSGRRFSIPAEFDLTSAINPDGDNLLAIEVVRTSAANEIGLGGLLRPGFLFTGPRLATPAPAPLELRRILPGGELGEVEK